jgi:hypothetical protein
VNGKDIVKQNRRRLCQVLRQPEVHNFGNLDLFGLVYFRDNSFCRVIKKQPDQSGPKAREKCGSQTSAVKAESDQNGSDYLAAASG